MGFLSSLAKYKTAKSGFGFTVVEVLIAMTIILIITGLGIPSFTSFNRKQTVKKVGSELRDNVNQTQNRALSGDKRCACGNPATDKDYVLSGWYLHFDLNSDTRSYTLDSKCKLRLDVGSYVCATQNQNSVDPKKITIKNTTSLRNNIDLQNSSGVTIVSPQRLDILFSPTTNVVKMFDDITTEATDYTGPPWSVEKAVITVQDVSDTNIKYQVVITKTGNIYEVQ